MPNDNVLTDDHAFQLYLLARRTSDWARWINELRASIAAHPGQQEPRAEVTDAARDVLAERRRQVEAEGWTAKHDDAHTGSEMALAAASYAMSAAGFSCGNIWPWDWHWYKPTTPRRDLVKAGALILAEVEKIDRAAARAGASS
ncbi:hypothetical protein [Burkholderia vietnamiensis]|uniref:hypothetical protein n=1 Tax=Burkholderia vietnamiensis TaxID=60552 RepID=UPI001B8EEEC2|nr:hypothetical protein [Burkholderia vietnamiensis]MBR8279752.1 hypothetical protein [Burkholderia vietnamiensis]